MEETQDTTAAVIEPLDAKIERIKAVATIVITAVVNVANMYGYAIDAESWINVFLTVLSFATILYSWWKNQNITEAAIEGQALVNSLKKK